MAISNTQAELVRLLADGKVHSGEALGETLGISRAAVWKALKKLPEYGLAVAQRAGSGYWLEQPLELLAGEQIVACMPTEAAARCRLEILMSCDSTNSQLRDAELPQAPCYRAMLSEHQQAGRGRQGRVWRSTFGQGIYLSLGQQRSGGLEQLSALSLVVGVGVCRALQAAGIDGIGLKWPNDLWVKDQKVGGILLEADGEFSGPCRWIAGVGLNWRLSGDINIDQDWTDLHRLSQGRLPGRNGFCGQLLGHLIEVCDGFASQGLAPFLSEWGTLDVLRGRPVRITGAGGAIDGIAEGLSAVGELLVRQGSEQIAVSSGEVSVRPQ